MSTLHLFQQAFSDIDHDDYLNIFLFELREFGLGEFEFYTVNIGWSVMKRITAITHRNYTLMFAEEKLTQENRLFFDQNSKRVEDKVLWTLEEKRLENQNTASIEELTKLLLFSNQYSSRFEPNGVCKDSPIDLYIEKSEVVHCAKIDGKFYVVLQQDGMVGYYEIYWEHGDVIKKILLKSNDFNSMFF